MKMNKWTLGLAALGLVSLASVAQAEEKSPVMSMVSGTTISGYVDASAVWNPGTGNANPPPFAFNGGKQDGFNVNAVDIKFSKALDEGQWSSGYNLDLMYAPDAEAVTGNTVRQAYVQLRAPLHNGVDFKVGRFDSIIGYESTDGYKNPNVTRSYGYTITPSENTGILADAKIVDCLNVAAGIANIANTTAGINDRSPRSESSKAYMAAMTLTAPESMGCLKGSALYAGVLDGFGAATQDRTDVYVGATIATPVEGLQVGVAYDEVHHMPGSPSFMVANTATPQGYANSIAGYLSFKATDKLSLHGRCEYFKTGTDFGAGKVLAVTGTIRYNLWDNVISRLEVRWDHSTQDYDLFGGKTAGAPTRGNAVMVAANVVYQF